MGERIEVLLGSDKVLGGFENVGAVTEGGDYFVAGLQLCARIRGGEKVGDGTTSDGCCLSGLAA